MSNIQKMRILSSIIKNRLGLAQYPSFITFLVTWRCNCKCIICDIWKKEKGEELSVQEIEHIFRQIESIDVIRISGGEPFLRDDIDDIIRVVDGTVHPEIIHITTNGLLTDRIVNTMKNVNLKSVKKIHLKISIDDIGEAHDKIRSVLGAYEKAISTVEELAQLRDKLHFYLGVDQTIVDEKGLQSYPELKSILKKFNVNIHPVIAYDKSFALYSNENSVVPPDNSYKTFGNFSNEHLEKFIRLLLKDASCLGSFEERTVKKYYLKCLYNRLVKNKNEPNPACVALNSHLKILPNGDIPICMYNATIVGNLKKDKFIDIWFSEKMKKHRQWVKQCKGCCADCESIVNAIYSGDIYKAFLGSGDF